MYFEREAASWDTHRRIQRAETLSERIYEQICEKKDRPVLEYGCGTGLISLGLQSRMQDITLMDSSPEMIRELTAKIHRGGLGNLHPLCRDLTRSRYSERQFGAVYASMVLHHIPDTRGILRALHGLLEEDGILCIVDLDREDGSFHSGETGFAGHNGFRREEMFSLFRETGLTGVSVCTVFQGQKSAGMRNVPYSLFCITGRRGPVM